MAFGWVVFLVLLCLFVFWHRVFNEGASVSVTPGTTITEDIPLPDLKGSDQLSVASDRTLSVNGQLKVNNSLIFDPSDPPENPVVGQVYYDKNTNAPMYYDGTRFVAVASKQDVEATKPQVTVVDTKAAGTVTVDVPDDIAQTSQPNNFTSNNTFMKGLEVDGFTALQSTSISSLILSQPLSVASGGTGVSSLAAGGILIGGGSGPITSLTAGSTGLCLMSTSGTPSFQTCPSGGTPNAVTSTSGTAGRLAKFGASNTIVDSLLSDNGSSVSVAGNLSLGAYNLQLGNNGFGTTLNTTTLSANRTVALPDASGTICLQGSTSCGFVTGTPAKFIQNQNASAQATSTYWIAGVGRADGGLLGPSFDTATNGLLSIGGTANSIALMDDTTINGVATVVTNSSSVNTPSLKVEQSGSGDSTIELKDSSGSSFYVGMDRSAGGVFRIGSSTAARTTSAVAQVSAGGSGFQNVDSQIIARKVVTGPADAGTLSSIYVYLRTIDNATPGLKVALYAHDAANNRPGTLVAATQTAATGAVGWNAVPLSAPVSASTTYWIAVNIEGDTTGLGFDYCGCGVDSTTTYPRPFSSAWPTTHGAPNNSLTDYEWSMYMTVAAGAVNDTFAGAKLFSMTATGSVVLQNGVDTASGFQVQDAAGTVVFNVDTTSGKTSVKGLSVADSLQMSNNGFGMTLNTTSLTADRSIVLPNESGTMCLQGSANCGFVAGDATNFIQNQFSGSQASSNFWISGEGRAGRFLANELQGHYIDAIEGSGDALVIGSSHATSVLLGHYGKSIVSAGQFTASQGIVVTDLGLTLQGSTGSYTTPLGYSLSTMINIPNYTVPDFSSILAFGLPSTSSASARGLLIADARTAVHQPTIGVLSPNEQDIFGLSWDGSDGVARLKTLGSSVGIRLSTNDVAQFQGSQIYLNQSTQVTGGLQVNGNSIFTPTSDSSDIFKIQGADTSAVLLRADSVGNKIVVRTLDVTYNLTVGGDVAFSGHLKSGGNNPTRVVGPAACTSPTVTVSGTDTAGIITVTAGTGCSSGGAIMAVTFANAFAAAPKISLTPATASAAALPAYVDYSQVTSSSFDIASSTPLSDGVQYRWYYHVIE